MESIVTLILSLLNNEKVGEMMKETSNARYWGTLAVIVLLVVILKIEAIAALF